MRRRSLLLTVFLFLSFHHSALAQGVRNEPRFAIDEGPPTLEQPQINRVPTSHLTMAGMVGLVAGFFGGAYLGAEYFGDRCSDENRDDPDACEWAPLLGGIIGAVAGESILIPISIHLANKGKGNLPLELLSSAGIGTLGAVAVFSDEAGILVGLIGVPIAQIAWTIKLERKAEQP
jgi:hypothetical protein